MKVSSTKSDVLKKLKERYIEIWWETPTEFPMPFQFYDPLQQRAGEREMENILDCAEREIKGDGRDGTDGSQARGPEVIKLVRRAGKCILGVTDEDMDILLQDKLMKATSDFIDGSGRFNPEGSIEDLMQALRNVWVMNCMQMLFGLGVEQTPSVFAYSMLYPYTDNYLDDDEVGSDDKSYTSRKFRMKLEGEKVKADNRYEDRLFKLIDMIESQYPRSEFQRVYKSLLDIHDAQQKSLSQQVKTVSPYETDIIGISFEKGGASVLADAWLVNGDLAGPVETFMFGFGVILQLADDLQDCSSDLKKGHMTLFSQTAGKWPLDGVTNRLFNFTSRIMDGCTCFTTADAGRILNIMKKSCNALILSAIASNSNMYGRDYIKRIEKYSPMSFRYVNRMKRRIGKDYNNFKRNSSQPVDTVFAQILAQCCS